MGYQETKAFINANIKQNGENEITGSILNTALNDVLDSGHDEVNQLGQSLGYTKEDFNENGYYNFDGTTPRLYESENYKSIVIPVIAGDVFSIKITATRKYGLTNTSQVILSSGTFSIGDNIVSVSEDGFLFLSARVEDSISVCRKNLARDIVNLEQKTITDSTPVADSNHLITSGAVDNISLVRILTYTTDAATTRCLVPQNSRKGGMILIYHNGTAFVVEQFIRNEDRLGNAAWGDSGFWKTLAYAADVDAVKDMVMKFLATNFVNKAASVTWVDNYYINKLGQVVASSGNCYSDPIDVEAGDVIYVDFRVNDVLGNNRSLVNKVTGSGTQQDPYVYESLLGYDSSHGSYSYICSETMKISVVARHATGVMPKVYQYNSLLAEYIAKEIDSLNPRVANHSRYLQDGSGVDVNTTENGSYFVNYSNGSTTDNANYRTTDGIWFNAGEIIELYAFGGSSVSLISKTDDFGKNAYFAPKIVGTDATITPVLFLVEESGYYSFSYRAADGIKVKKYSQGTINANTRAIEVNAQKRRNFVKSVSHQGTPFSGNNMLSRLYHSCLQGFDYNLVNLSFTSDGIPVLNHDGYYTNQDGQVVTIDEHTYAEIAEMPVKNRNGEILAKFDDFVKMCKLLNTKIVIMGFSTYYLSAENVQTTYDIINQYQMRDNVIWGIDAMSVNDILSWNPRAKIMLQYTADLVVANLITAITTYSASLNGKNKIIMWLNGEAGWSIEDIKTANKSLPVDMEIGMFFIGDKTELFLSYLPYITYYTHDYFTLEDKRTQINNTAKDLVHFNP